MSATPFVTRWGIMATGGIARTFTRDLLIDPKSRDVHDVVHKVVAVASSGGKQNRAKDFIKETESPSDARAYGTYEELVKDPDVDIVYIASPHTFHYGNALLALQHGKAVCCEKPFTINAGQTRHLVKLAKEKNVFLMEAVWIRFFPLVLALQKAIHQDRVLGKLKRVKSDFAKYFAFDAKHRLFDPELGGGALLDLGLYSTTWLMLTLYSDPDNAHTMPSQIASSMLKVPQTGVDAEVTAGLVFEKLHATGTMTTSSQVETFTDAYHTLIQGEKGDITVHGMPYRPESFTIHLRDPDGKTTSTKKHEFKIPGHGMFWEADACGRNLRDGMKEEPLCSWQDSIATMTVFDTIRKQNDFSYPAALEAFES